uniref:Putative reverse transcriptase/maturase n=1 Tax=Boldia erythrosiphon TaxID=74908 RepID=A0A1Y9TLY2_9RHOD|nr:putative reverse transcriptase/maturase [Boldia erythrosiphon]ARO90630.1 putative reverse transcriptase/maturase [Boldia erythrosiphon]
MKGYSIMINSISVIRPNDYIPLKLEYLDVLDWYSLPWIKIEKFVFNFQKQIYRFSIDNDTNNIHALQVLLSQSYEIKLLAVKKAIENKRKNKVIFNRLNSFNSKQKLELAHNLGLQFSLDNTEFDNGSGFNLIKQEATDIIIYLCLQPEWEAKFELNNYSFSLIIPIKKVIANIIIKLKNYEDNNTDIYLLSGLIEGSFFSLNKHYLFKILSTIPVFEMYIQTILKNQFDSPNLFDKIDFSSSQSSCNNLLELLSHIILFNFELSIVSTLIKQVDNNILSLKIIRFKNNFVVVSNSLKILQNTIYQCLKFLDEAGLSYNWKKTKLFTNQQQFHFLGFSIKSDILITYNRIHRCLIVQPTKEEKKLILAKIRYILRNRHKNGKTRARTNMPLSKAISLINPLVVNWRGYYMDFIPKSILIKMDWLLNEKIYRWYIKRLKKNRVNHWNNNCIQFVNGRRRICSDNYTLELFTHI